METSSKAKLRLGLLLGALALVCLLVLFQLARHPETAVLLVSMPGPAALACNLRCVGLAPFLQVLGEGLKALFLIGLSGLLLNALFRMARRIIRTWSFMDQAERRAVPAPAVPPHSFLERVTVFEDPHPLAFTAGFFRPGIFISTALADVLDEKELRAVVLHESHHRDARDPLKGLLASFVADLLFFLPAGRALKSAYTLASEMTADAQAVERQADPLDLAGSLLKVRRSGGPAASWFADPAAERTRRLLGQPSRIAWPFKKAAVAVVFLSIAALVALLPVRKSLTAMFIDHDKTCVLNAGRGMTAGERR